MVCPSCNTETKGVSVNKNLFCANCGEALPATSADEIEIINTEPTPNVPEAKIIIGEKIKKLQEEITSEINLLEAEEEVLAVIKDESASPAKTKGKKPETKPKLKVGKKKIIKANRKRTDVRHEKDYILLTNEPDPISDLELSPPHDDQIEASKGPNYNIKGTDNEIDLSRFSSSEKYPLLDEETRKYLEKKQNRRNEALVNFLKNSASKASQNKYKKNKWDKRKKLYGLIFVFFFLTGLASGIFIYLAAYQGKTREQAAPTQSPSIFVYKDPEYIPVGYILSSLPNATESEITFEYSYTSDQSRKLEVRVSKSSLTEETLYEQLIKPTGLDYTKESAGSRSYWVVGEVSLYFLKDNLLYEIISSDKMPKEELIKIANGLL